MKVKEVALNEFKETKANLKDKQRGYKREYYLTHKEQYKLANKKYYETHKKEILAYIKNYQETHKAQLKEAMHRYYETHKEQYRQRYRDYYNKHLRGLSSYSISTQKRFFNKVWKEVKSGNKES